MSTANATFDRTSAKPLAIIGNTLRPAAASSEPVDARPVNWGRFGSLTADQAASQLAFAWNEQRGAALADAKGITWAVPHQPGIAQSYLSRQPRQDFIFRPAASKRDDLWLPSCEGSAALMTSMGVAVTSGYDAKGNWTGCALPTNAKAITLGQMADHIERVMGYQGDAHGWTVNYLNDKGSLRCLHASEKADGALVIMDGVDNLRIADLRSYANAGPHLKDAQRLDFDGAKLKVRHPIKGMPNLTHDVVAIFPRGVDRINSWEVPAAPAASAAAMVNLTPEFLTWHQGLTARE